MWLEAVVWSRLDRDSHTLRLAQLRKSSHELEDTSGFAVSSSLDRLVDIFGRVSAQGVVKPGDELVPVVLRHRHECPAHQAGLFSTETDK